MKIVFFVGWLLVTSCWDCQQKRNLFSKLCPSEFVHPYLPPIWPFAMECYNRLIPANFGQRQITSCVLTQLKINSFQRFKSTKQIIWELIWGKFGILEKDCFLLNGVTCSHQVKWERSQEMKIGRILSEECLKGKARKLLNAQKGKKNFKMPKGQKKTLKC